MSAADTIAARPQPPQRAQRAPKCCGSLLRSPTFLVGLGIVLFWVVCALFGEHFAPYDPLADDILNALAPPSAEHWFGTDQLGRDVFSRVIVGARDILTVAPLATLARHRRRARRSACSPAISAAWSTRSSAAFIEAFLAIPVVIVALLALVALGTSKATVIVVIGLSFAPIIARTVRSAVLAERELDYVAAAQLRRESALHIMFVEILPNVAAADPGRDHGAARLCDLRGRDARASSASASSRPRPTGA